METKQEKIQDIIANYAVCLIYIVLLPLLLILWIGTLAAWLTLKANTFWHVEK